MPKEQSRPDRPNRWWLAPVIGLVVLFAAGSGLAARTIYQRAADTSVATGASTPPRTTGPSSASPAPNTGTVQLLADASAYPQSAQVAALLQTYFDAVNNGNYGLWRKSVITKLAQQNPEASWQAGRQTTSDRQISVFRIDAAPDDELRVLVTFTSRQEPAYAPQPDPTDCTHWQNIMSLARGSSGSWLIAGSIVQHQPC
ncbi:MAG TPA: hypothetical protein VHW44_14255 [Pseudonocardiaceae bacterium]|nr:hypothetical protein [Pseudonocardiaceae bacterium]